MNDYNLTEILEYIDPSTCSYQEWINVGMALKHEGYTVSDWDMWSMKDVNRYHSGECAKKVGDISRLICSRYCRNYHSNG